MANAIARRSFLAAFLPITGMTVPMTQFNVSGTLERTGQEGEGYYAIGQYFGVQIHPEKLPALYQQAEKLVGKPARVILEAA